MTSGALQTVWDRLVPSGVRFGSQGVSVIAIRVLGAGLGLCAQVLASRLIGPEAFGHYALALVWLLLLGHGATAGTSQLVCRYLSHYLHRQEKQEAAGLVRFALALAGAVAGLLTLAAILLVRSGLLGLDTATITLATLAFAVIPLIALQDFFEAVARGLDKPNLGIAPAFLMRHLAIITGVGALMAMGVGADALFVLAMTVLGLVASVLVQFFLLERHLRGALGGARPVYQVRKWFGTALPVALVDLCEVLFQNADILILGLFVPAEWVAFYFAATRLSQFLGYVPYGISAATAQKYAGLAATGRRGELEGLVAGATLLSTGLTVLAALALWALAGPLLGLFGPDYAVAAPVVPVLCLGVILTCALGPGEDVLTMLGEERACSAVFVLAALVNVGLNFLLIPFWGIMGAALATALALGVRAAVLAVLARRRLGLWLPLGSHLIWGKGRWGQ